MALLFETEYTSTLDLQTKSDETFFNWAAFSKLQRFNFNDLYVSFKEQQLWQIQRNVVGR